MMTINLIRFYINKSTNEFILNLLNCIIYNMVYAYFILFWCFSDKEK